VARDRSEAYAAGIRQGAPEATQVADRFHLLTNMAAALQEVFRAHAPALAALRKPQEPETPQDAAGTTPVASSPPLSRAQQQIALTRARRLAEYNQVRALRQQGYTIKAIAAQVGRNRRTVKKYAQAATFPERQPRRRRFPTVLDPYKAVLQERWQTGCHQAKQLFREIQAQGFRGQYSIVAAYISGLRSAPERVTTRRRGQPVSSPEGAPTPLTPRSATWLVMRREATLSEDDQHQLAQLQAQEGKLTDAIALTQEFTALVRQRQPEQLESWLQRAVASGLQAFQSFAQGLRADYEAVKAGLTLPWSTGPVEGQINRLKMLKRQMYGRASIGLLRQRVLSPPWDP
jgi:transposase